MCWLGSSCLFAEGLLRLIGVIPPLLPWLNHIVDWIITAILFSVTMFIQGHFIFHGKHGYRRGEREQEKMSETRKQIEDLLKDK